MEDVLARAWVEIKWEEEKLYHSHRTSYDSRTEEWCPKCPSNHPTSRKTLAHLSFTLRLYGGDQHATLNKPSTKSSAHFTALIDDSQILEYNLNVEPIEVVSIIKGKENTMIWLWKSNNLDPKRDTTKWCEFHADHSHSIPDCITLHLEVADLLKRGNL